ncbi:MAG TPA: PspC domain-containing protein [Paludibaculum sp.]|jgi:phage shock protein PspC (stress-responsive transcriptional regulator)
MYCTNCGTQTAETDRFCAHCGKGTGAGQASRPSAPYTASPGPPLDRDIANKKIAGVCAGIARHFGWDVTLVRVAFLAGVLVHGVGLIGYIIAWICMPRDDRQVLAQA